MPFIYKGKMVTPELGETLLTKMSMRELIDYESYLWQWMTSSPPRVVNVLNAIYREIEWRAQDTAFKQRRRPPTLGEGGR